MIRTIASRTMRRNWRSRASRSRAQRACWVTRIIPSSMRVDRLVVEYSIAVTNNWNKTRDEIFARLRAAFLRSPDRRTDLAHRAVRRVQPLQRHPAIRYRAGRPGARGGGVICSPSPLRGGVRGGGLQARLPLWHPHPRPLPARGRGENTRIPISRITPCFPAANHRLNAAHPVPQEGRSRTSRTLGQAAVGAGPVAARESVRTYGGG